MCLEISNNLLLMLQDAPKCIFSTNLRSAGQPKNYAKTLFPTLHPLSTVIFASATVLAFVRLHDSKFNFHCYTQREATPTQKSAWKCTATSRDFLRERLQSAFTLTSFTESPNKGHERGPMERLHLCMSNRLLFYLRLNVMSSNEKFNRRVGGTEAKVKYN